MRVPALLATALCLVTSLLGSSQTPSSPPLVTVRAELIKTLRSNTLKQDDQVFFRTTEIWQRPDCKVPVDTSIHGKVVSIDRSGVGPRRNTLALSFSRLPCHGSDQLNLVPVLVAMQHHEQFEDSALRRLATAGLEDSTISSMFNPGAHGPGVPRSIDTAGDAAGATAYSSLGAIQSDNAPLKTGEVFGIHGLKLELPAARDVSTNLVSPHEIFLDRTTTSFVFALINAPLPVPQRNENATAGKQSTPRKLATRDEADEKEVCAASGCNQVALPATDLANTAVWSLPLAQLGFQPRPEQPMAALQTSASVHALGEDQILLTFPVHTLIKRSQTQSAWSRPRKIRAVVIARENGRVLLMKDWTVPQDAGAYVWDFGPGRVVAQVGNDLVSFGPNLTEEHRLPLGGPLVFLSPAPEGELALVATIHEKHSKGEHEALARFLGPDQPIDENYDLTAIDGDLHAIGTRLLYAQPAQPAILRSAMISAHQGHEGHWELDQTTWSGERKVLARLQSGCNITVTSLPGDLLLARGCVPHQSDTTFYRVLDTKGATRLKGTSDRFSYLQQAATDASGDLFGIASSHFDQPFDFKFQVHAGEFQNLALSLFSAQNGKLVFSTHLASGSPEQDTFCLSPSGRTLAVLTSAGLQAYAVPSAVATSITH